MTSEEWNRVFVFRRGLIELDAVLRKAARLANALIDFPLDPEAYDHVRATLVNDICLNVEEAEEATRRLIYETGEILLKISTAEKAKP